MRPTIPQKYPTLAAFDPLIATVNQSLLAWRNVTGSSPHIPVWKRKSWTTPLRSVLENLGPSASIIKTTSARIISILASIITSTIANAPKMNEEIPTVNAKPEGTQELAAS